MNIKEHFFLIPITFEFSLLAHWFTFETEVVVPVVADVALNHSTYFIVIFKSVGKSCRIPLCAVITSFQLVYFVMLGTTKMNLTLNLYFVLRTVFVWISYRNSLSIFDPVFFNHELILPLILGIIIVGHVTAIQGAKCMHIVLTLLVPLRIDQEANPRNILLLRPFMPLEHALVGVELARYFQRACLLFTNSY